MNLKSRIDAFTQLGEKLIDSSTFEIIITKAKVENPWFTKVNIELALEAIALNMLGKSVLSEWLKDYDFRTERSTQPTVALILAGNIPAVGFHDILCVLISGCKAQIKLSSKDSILIPYLLDTLIEISPDFKKRIQYVERISSFDAVIATGSNNTAIHFQHYFSKYPHIIRKNRKSVAIVHKDFTDNDLRNLGDDIFRYFGLGCRNVSKLYIERGTDLTRLMEVWHENKEIVLHNKYKNNYDYNYTLLLMNGAEFLMNGALLLVAEKGVHSRIATVNYEFYDDEKQLCSELDEIKDEIQCIVSKQSNKELNIILPGQSQHPKLNDYADHIDTIKFLLSI